MNIIVGFASLIFLIIGVAIGYIIYFIKHIKYIEGLINRLKLAAENLQIENAKLTVELEDTLILKQVVAGDNIREGELICITHDGKAKGMAPASKESS